MYCGWLIFCTNPMSGKILVLEIYVQKLSTNQIAKFLKLLYIFWAIQSFFIIFSIKIEYHKTFKMSLFWKIVDLAQKGQKGEKVGRAVGQNLFFCILLKIGSLDFFLIFCMKLETIIKSHCSFLIFLFL